MSWNCYCPDLQLFGFKGLYKEKLFVVPLHQVFFAGVFFDSGSIELQVFREFPVLCNEFGKIVLGLADLAQFFSPFQLGKHVITIKKQDPDKKAKEGNKIFIFYPGGYLRQKFHVYDKDKTVGRESKFYRRNMLVVR
jgi:hypothetical protein